MRILRNHMLSLMALLVLSLTTLPVFAQKDASARKLLDATSSKLSSLKSAKADFQITSFIGTQEQGNATGTMYIEGKKYKMVTPDLITWFDGKTQWAYMPSTEEVNISTPTKKEQAATNPYSFIGIYKKGYNYTVSNTTYNGKSAREVRLTAESSSADIQEARIVITPDNLPSSIRIRQGKNNWTRIRISSLKGNQKFSKDTFTFPAGEYANAEIIDLR